MNSKPIQEISWQRVEQLLKPFIEVYGTRNKFDGLVPVARGGLIPATILSNRMMLPILGMIQSESYDGQMQVGINIKFPDIAALPRVLIVEDIIDTGSTLAEISLHDRFADSEIVSLCVRDTFESKLSQLKVHALSIVPEGVWIKFPWE